MNEDVRDNRTDIVGAGFTGHTSRNGLVWTYRNGNVSGDYRPVRFMRMTRVSHWGESGCNRICRRYEFGMGLARKAHSRINRVPLPTQAFHCPRVEAITFQVYSISSQELRYLRFSTSDSLLTGNTVLVLQYHMELSHQSISCEKYQSKKARIRIGAHVA